MGVSAFGTCCRLRSSEHLLQHGEDRLEVLKVLCSTVIAEPVAEVRLLIRIHAPFLWHGPSHASNGTVVSLVNVNECHFVFAGHLQRTPVEQMLDAIGDRVIGALRHDEPVDVSVARSLDIRLRVVQKHHNVPDRSRFRESFQRVP